MASSVISIRLSVLPRELAASSVIGISLSVLPRELALRSWFRMDRRCAANWSGSQVPPGHSKRYLARDVDENVEQDKDVNEDQDED